MKHFFRTILGLAILGCVLISTQAYAMFELSVSPRRGGRDIRFEASRGSGYLRNEEVEIRIDTDEASQYRLSQTVHQPLTSEMGKTIPQGAFVAFSPSSTLGTLRTQLETPVTMGQMPIYTSNSAGDSDSFILVFNVLVPENQAGGTYRTQITFTAELIDPKPGVTPRVINLQITLEIQPTFQMKIESAKGGRELNLGRITQNSPSVFGVLNIDIQSNIGTTYRLIQQLSDPLTSQEGEALGQTAFTAVQSKGEGVEMSSSPTVIYTSSDSGGSDALQIQYAVTPDVIQRAGIYSGTLSFRIESNSPLVSQEIVRVPIQVEIEPIFYLDIEAENGSGIGFGLFKGGEEKKGRQVTITVSSNLGLPYQVTQIVPRSLTNSEGGFISRENFVYFGENVPTGIIKERTPSPVQEGESLVFTSDSLGTPEKFVLNYLLTIPPGTKAGSYQAEVKYSSTTL